MAEFVAGLRPNAANGFKRGGFLEVRDQANPLPSWLNRQRLRGHRSESLTARVGARCR